MFPRFLAGSGARRAPVPACVLGLGRHFDCVVRADCRYLECLTDRRALNQPTLEGAALDEGEAAVSASAQTVDLERYGHALPGAESRRRFVDLGLDGGRTGSVRR